MADWPTIASSATAGGTLVLAAVREPDDPFREGLHEASLTGEMLTVDLLYGDHEDGQRRSAA